MKQIATERSKLLLSGTGGGTVLVFAHLVWVEWYCRRWGMLLYHAIRIARQWEIKKARQKVRAVPSTGSGQVTALTARNWKRYFLLWEWGIGIREWVLWILGFWDFELY